jgi:hypothetical protein
MNKRDFIVQGGTLLTGAAWLPAVGHPVSAASANDASAAPGATPGGAPSQLQEWQALEGQVFEARTASGRAVELVLNKVGACGRMTPDEAPRPFTVRLRGPRSLPLQAGTHTLHHPDTGLIALHLEPAQRGEFITYDAHLGMLA